MVRSPGPMTPRSIRLSEPLLEPAAVPPRCFLNTPKHGLCFNAIAAYEIVNQPVIQVVRRPFEVLFRDSAKPSKGNLTPRATSTTSRLFYQGTSRFRNMKIAAVGPVQGLELLHSQCQFGLDTLSWVRLRPRPHREANVGLRPPYSTDSVAVLLTSVPAARVTGAAAPDASSRR